MRLLPAVIIAVAIVLAPVLWFALPRMFNAEDGGGSAIDSGARIEIEMLNQRMDDLRNRIETLTEELRDRESRNLAAESDGSQLASLGSRSTPRTGPNQIRDSYAQVVQIANRLQVNDTLRPASPAFLSETFGLPREDLTNECQGMTNERLVDKLVLEEVGPIRVRMLEPAVESLRRVFENVRDTDQDLYDRINTAGSLCVRLIRGARNSASTHSYGLAVDLNIDGRLDTLGDGRTQLGLTILADFFREEGWIWGAAWRREDSMHFEVSRQKIEKWVEEGVL